MIVRELSVSRCAEGMTVNRMRFARVGAREGGPPDATLDVVARQLKGDIEVSGWISLEASRRSEVIVREILSSRARSAMPGEHVSRR